MEEAGNENSPEMKSPGYEVIAAWPLLAGNVKN
jgi:hypothetical protein